MHLFCGSRVLPFSGLDAYHSFVNIPFPYPRHCVAARAGPPNRQTSASSFARPAAPKRLMMADVTVTRVVQNSCWSCDPWGGFRVRELPEFAKEAVGATCRHDIGICVEQTWRLDKGEGGRKFPAAVVFQGNLCMRSRLGCRSVSRLGQFLCDHGSCPGSGFIRAPCWTPHRLGRCRPSLCAGQHAEGRRFNPGRCRIKVYVQVDVGGTPIWIFPPQAPHY